MVGLAQTSMQEVIRAQVERTQIQRTQVELITNWATPLYWQPGAVATQRSVRAKRAESTDAQGSSPSSGLGALAADFR